MFLNSSQWRSFQESLGRKTFNLGEGFLVKLDIPFGKNYLYSNYPDAPKYKKTIKKIAKQENAMFFKWEPMIVQGSDFKPQSIKGIGFQKAQKELQPQKTIILDLTKNEDKLMSDMHKKTRYNIRLAERRGVVVGESESFDKFWQLIRQTAQRDNFHTHTKEYYKKLLELPMTKLYLAGKGEQVHAGAIISFFNMRATYLHGASDYRFRRDMAPHLLHWEIIRRAKEGGIKEYDLWGIDEKKWSGVTRFKRGFSEEEIEYIGSWDIPFQKFWYNLYRFKNELSG
ncbi:MAG: peptidoglycan bridge formation glycyltransferase FemA/FemB family protein [Candidatus Spechtbacterales bacterium]|nr:peptidoglycan bridge formation glycyltransferase FemA/FemB family protein [Candidatus Spechtbacterales bacterium]